jgi:hypothetical protein
MRTVLTVLLLTACTDHVATDAEVHAQVECDSAWSGHNGVVSHAYCEAACADFGDLGHNTDCTYNGGQQCGVHIGRMEGREGCCVTGDEAAGFAVTFYDCE